MRSIAVIVLLVGTVCSLGLVLNAGRHTPVFLLILFIGWVLSPFLAFLVANRISRSWSDYARATIYYLMIMVTLGSLVGYSGAFNSPHTKPAFIFLVVPLISWVLIVIVIPISRRLSRKNKNIKDLNSQRNL